MCTRSRKTCRSVNGVNFEFGHRASGRWYHEKGQIEPPYSMAQKTKKEEKSEATSNKLKASKQKGITSRSN